MKRFIAVDWVLLVRIGLLVAFVRLVLWTRPWPRAVQRVRSLSPHFFSSRTSRFSADRLAWAVRHASRLVPDATCLTQSLALQCALTAAGLPSRVDIGVSKDPGGEFLSHAWVEHNGRTLLSAPDEVLRYSRLLSLQTAAQPDLPPRKGETGRRKSSPSPT